MSVYFVHLAGHISFNISGDEVFHVGPLILGLDQLDGFHDSGVSDGF